MATKLKIGYDRDVLPVLEYNSPLAKLYMEEAHQVDHGGLDRMVQRARKKVWIVMARRVAKVVKNNCFKCKLLYKKHLEQAMGPLPDHRVGPDRVFGSVAVDLFGPLTVRDAVKKRVTMKTWGVVFTCTKTSAAVFELIESYSTDAFMHALDRFVFQWGIPYRIQSDAGDQLVAASKQVATWDFSRLQDWTRGKKTEWVVLPTGGQHFNGVAERMVGQAKLALEQVLGNKIATFGEMQTLLKRAEYIVNSRPLKVQPGSDPEMMAPITPMHIMYGRSDIEMPVLKFELNPSLTRRMQFWEEVKKEFWEKWTMLIFGQMVPSHKWRKEARDLVVGDVVLMKEETLASRSYRLGRVEEVFPGKDGHVRRVIVAYKNPGEKVFRKTERPIHNLVLIVPEE